MVSWQTTITALLALLVLSGFSSVETKKRKKGKHLFQGETLQEMCQSAGHDSLKRNILELQAFFDLDKSFACLKVETCSRIPVCFVEDTPDLGQENLNDCTLWNLLLHGLQTNRKIEPVLEHAMNSLNRGKSRTDNSWDDAVSSLCHGANVYRFLTEDISEEENASSNATSQNSSTINTINQNHNPTNGSMTTPLTNALPRKRRLRRARGGSFNRLLRQLRRKQIALGNSSSCTGLDGCTRICVGQNDRLTNLSDCSTFKIICTFKKLFRSRRKQKGKGRKKNTRPAK